MSKQFPKPNGVKTLAHLNTLEGWNTLLSESVNDSDCSGSCKSRVQMKISFQSFFFFFFNHVVNEFHYKFHWDVIFGELSAWRNANDYREGNDTENVN